MVKLPKDGDVDDLDRDNVADTYQSKEDQLDDGRQSNEDGDGQQRQHGSEVDVVRSVTVEVLTTVERDHRVHGADRGYSG